MTVTDDLWVEATRDVEREQASLRLFEAQQRCADLWPFMALARSQEELDHRLALVRDTLDERVPDPLVQEALLGGFTANFKIGYSADLNSDTGEDEEGASSASGIATSGSGLQDQDGTPDITASLHGAMQIWHAAKRQWITVTAVQSPTEANPGYFSGGPEAGPMTAETGTFPVEVGGPDPWNPINGNLPLPPTNVIPPANRFPAQPQPWMIPPDAGWVDNPMNFDSGPNAHKGSVGEDLSGAQQSNPNYFGQGQIGLQSEEGASFPVDVALPEPDERVDMYQNATPHCAPGAGEPMGGLGGPAVNFTIPPQYVTGAKSNVAACATCGRPAYREGRKWHHLDPHLKGDHNVMLDADHPWVQQMAHSSVRHTAPGGGEHAPYRIEAGEGGYFVVNDRGERKNSKPKTKVQARQFQKALYKNVPGSAESAEQDEAKKAASRKIANQYIKKDGDQWVITQKGTGKILSHHDSEEMAEKAFSAMEWHKHEGHFIHVADMSGTPAANPFPTASPGTTPMQAPSPSIPPSMTQGAPGAEAMPPMASGSGTAGNGGPVSKIPTTGSVNSRVASFFHMGEGNIRERPTQQNPTGAGDEFEANTWEGPLNQHPRQSAEQRGINTPQVPGSPIPQISSSDNPGANERSAQQDEDDDE